MRIKTTDKPSTASFFDDYHTSNVKALLIDCDGVIYNKQDCTYEDIAIVGFGKAMDILNIPRADLAPTRAELKGRGVHGLLNAALAMCDKQNIPFDSFAMEMVKNIDYSRIEPDWDMLRLLRDCGAKMPIYIVTNNTRPHVEKIFTCLRGGRPFENVEESLNIRLVTIENTLADGVFHPKKTGTQLTDLCVQIGQLPENVLLLDDTADVCQAAQIQGLQVRPIKTPYDTKMILRSIIYEKSRSERAIPVRKTRGFFGR